MTGRTTVLLTPEDIDAAVKKVPAYTKILTEVLQPAAVEAGVGHVTWHQFRHIHSTLLNDLNVPVKIAQGQLGHASIQTTLNIYTHLVDASHRQAIEVVERRLFPTVPNSPDRLAKVQRIASTRSMFGIDSHWRPIAIVLPRIPHPTTGTLPNFPHEVRSGLSRASSNGTTTPSVLVELQETREQNTCPSAP